MVRPGADDIKAYIIDRCLSAGFAAVGFADADPMQDQRPLRDWIRNGYHGSMQWFIRHSVLRRDLGNVLPGVRTVVSVMYRYMYGQTMPTDGPRIAKYAWGLDYHDLIRRKLHGILSELKRLYPGIQGRAVCDTAPIDERFYAARAGLGFIGRNRMLIHRKCGSFFMLGELLLDISLPSDTGAGIVADGCGRCRICIEACPVQALREGFIEARRCLSYHTIERTRQNDDVDEDKIPTASERRGWVYGCDICQDVCPYNRRARFDNVAPSDFGFRDYSTIQWREAEAMDDGAFHQRFSSTPVYRIGRAAFTENVRHCRS